MEYRISEIAEKLGGRLVGAGDLVITGFRDLKNATAKEISFLADEKKCDELFSSKAGCVVSRKYFPEFAAPQIVTDNPGLYFTKVIELFYKNPCLSLKGIEEGAFVHSDFVLSSGLFVGRGAYIDSGCVIGERTKILQNVYIGRNSSIGADCIIYPNVTIREGIKIGRGVIIHSGTVIGSDGFGYIKDGPKSVKFEQTGTVEVSDDVEIGANTAIDRATFGATRIGKGTKIDNLVHIAHNVEIGENCFICGQVGFAGSVKIGNNVTLAGQAGVSGHLEIGDNVVVGGQAGVARSLRGNQIVSGYPARPHDQARKIYAIMNHLPEIYETVLKLKKAVFDKPGSKTKEEEKRENA